MVGVGTLSGALNTTATNVVLKGGHDPVVVNNYLEIDTEQMKVTAVVNPNSFTVTRAQNGTVAANHANGASVVIGASGADFVGVVVVTAWIKDGNGYWMKGNPALN